MTEQEAIKCFKPIVDNEAYTDRFQDACKMAIQALEKQIPKMVRRSGVTDDKGVFHPINGINGEPYYLCPKCDINLCVDGPFGHDKKRMKCCYNCGQKLDFGG